MRKSIWIKAAAILLPLAAAFAADRPATPQPPTCYVGFSPELKVDNVYLHPTCVGVRPSQVLKVGTPAVFTFTNLEGDPAYKKSVKVTLQDGDPAFWVDYPADVPRKVSLQLKLADNPAAKGRHR